MLSKKLKELRESMTTEMKIIEENKKIDNKSCETMTNIFTEIEKEMKKEIKKQKENKEEI